MEENQIEKMVQEIIRFIKKKQMWETDTAIYTANERYDHNGTVPSCKVIKGVMHMWFEGPLNYAINHGLKDPQYKILKGLNEIVEKYGYYTEFDTNCDFNVYPNPEVANNGDNN